MTPTDKKTGDRSMDLQKNSYLCPIKNEENIRST